MVPLGGGLRIDERITLDGDVDDLPRVGVAFSVPAGWDHLQWFGLGPGDSYPDRRAASTVGRWNVPVADQTMAFMVPQAYGLHLDTRWFALTDPVRGRRGASPRAAGLVIWGDRPFAFSALPYSTADLTTATHAHQLEADATTHVHLDLAHRALGSAACGPEPDDRFRISTGTFRLRWYVAAVGPGVDPASVVATTAS